MVLRPGRNPYCLLVLSSFFVSLMFSCIRILLRILQGGDVSAIGLLLDAVRGLVVFGIGMMLADFHCDAIKLICRLMLKRCAITSHSSYLAF
jgi:hypothetical protein